MKEEIIESLLTKVKGKYIGKVYFDTNTKRFVQIRRYSSLFTKKMVCSCPCDYYSDATTTIDMRFLSTEYIAKYLIAIDFSDTETFEHDGNGWHIVGAIF